LLNVSAAYGRRDLDIGRDEDEVEDEERTSKECYALLGARVSASGFGEGRVLEDGARFGHVGRVIGRIGGRCARKSW
jgi:hypothetical protein